MAGMFATAEKGASSWLTLKKLLSISGVTLFIIILLAYALVQYLHSGDPLDLIKDPGRRFASATTELDNQSLTIIENGGAVVRGDTWLGNSWKTIWTCLKLAGAIFMIVMFVRIFAWFYEKVVFGTEFPVKSWIAALLTFLLVQVIYLLATDPSPDKSGLMIRPFLAFYHFGQSLPYLIKPAAEELKRIESSELLNATLAS